MLLLIFESKDAFACSTRPPASSVPNFEGLVIWAVYSLGIHEIVLVVRDVRRAAGFYCGILELPEINPTTDEWATMATISLSDGQWLGLRKGPLLFEEFSPRPEGQRFGPVHFAFRGDPSTEGAFLRNAARRGVTVYGPQSFEGRMQGRSYYFFDPDDNLVELWFPVAKVAGVPAAV